MSELNMREIAEEARRAVRLALTAFFILLAVAGAAGLVLWLGSGLEFIQSIGVR